MTSPDPPTSAPPPTPRSLAFDRIADLYDETRGGEARGRRLAADLDRVLDRARSVLEIGAGTGVVALGLRDLGHRVVGVDVSEAMLGAARRRVGSRVVAGDATRLPFPDGVFEQAYGVWVLHVVGDQLGMLREAARVVAPGGRLVIVPALGPRPTDRPGAVVWDMQRALDEDGVRRDDQERVRELAPLAGLRVAAVRALSGAGYEETPAQTLAKLEGRSYSILWDVDAEQWERIVVPAIEAIRSIPDPDLPVRRYADGELIVLEHVGR